MNNNTISQTLLQVLTDTRLQALIDYWQKLSVRKQRLVLRLIRTLAK